MIARGLIGLHMQWSWPHEIGSGAADAALGIFVYALLDRVKQRTSFVGVSPEPRQAASLHRASSLSHQDSIGERSRRQRGDKIHRFIADPSAALDGSSKQTIRQHPGKA